LAHPNPAVLMMIDFRFGFRQLFSLVNPVEAFRAQ
jgi:hypothetical protein